MRLSTPDSRRNVRLKASAENVVESTLIPAMPGTITSRSSWLPEKIAPKKARNSSGSRKLKNAALGLRQKSLRSRRYCFHVSTASDLIGGQLQVDVLQRRAGDLDLVEALAAGQRLAGQLVQGARRIVGDRLDQLARGLAVGDAHPPGPVHAPPAPLPPRRAESTPSSRGGPSARMRPPLMIATRSASACASSR